MWIVGYIMVTIKRRKYPRGLEALRTRWKDGRAARDGQQMPSMGTQRKQGDARRWQISPHETTPLGCMQGAGHTTTHIPSKAPHNRLHSVFRTFRSSVAVLIDNMYAALMDHGGVTTGYCLPTLPTCRYIVSDSHVCECVYLL